MQIDTRTAWVLGLLLVSVSVGGAHAERILAPKAIWQGMSAGLTDIQTMTASLMVYDMQRIEMVANELAAREEYIAGIEQLPDVVKEGHAEVAKAAKVLAEAAAFGDDQAVTVA